jgi:uncharacterized protein YjiS (DUF1127 family)
MSNISTHSIHPAHEAAHASLVRRALNYLVEPIQRLKAINELEGLSERQLRDIGVDRREIKEIAERELTRLRSR